MSKLKNILDNENILEQIRKLFFPTIKEGILTGYNMYAEKIEIAKIPYTLNYAHSDLTKRHRHYKESSDLLEKEGFVESLLTIKYRLIDRYATYITIPRWGKKKMRYFLIDGTEIDFEKAKSLEVMLVGEGKEYDLYLQVKDESELQELTKIFKLYTNKYQLNYLGRVKYDKNKKPLKNTSAIYNAWEIPLLTINVEKKPRNMKDFLKVNKFDIELEFGGIEVIISTLVRSKTKEFRKIIKNKNLIFTIGKRYALRSFIEDYIEG